MLFVYGGAVLRSESCLYSLSGYIQIIERTPSGDEEADEMLFVKSVYAIFIASLGLAKQSPEPTNHSLLLQKLFFLR